MLKNQEAMTSSDDATTLVKCLGSSGLKCGIVGALQSLGLLLSWDGHPLNSPFESTRCLPHHPTAPSPKLFLRLSIGSGGGGRACICSHGEPGHLPAVYRKQGRNWRAGGSRYRACLMRLSMWKRQSRVGVQMIWGQYRRQKLLLNMQPPRG